MDIFVDVMTIFIYICVVFFSYFLYYKDRSILEKVKEFGSFSSRVLVEDRRTVLVLVVFS